MSIEDERWDPNALLVCPYDDSHRVCVQRFQRHILKCRKNHQDKDTVACPYNATHIVMRDDLRSHLGSCTSRVAMDADVIKAQNEETGEIERLMGNVSVPDPTYIPPPVSEDWDDEAEKHQKIIKTFKESSKSKEPSVTQYGEGGRNTLKNSKNSNASKGRTNSAIDQDVRPYVRMAGRGFTFSTSSKDSKEHPPLGGGRGTVLKSAMRPGLNFQ